ncbi:MAG: hypothetical protein EOO09_03275 [Chitinophagaceae bacterium]|nr:MAG: hypothetical protein EOO09_03275 [Chitinophagaceae bacterium]
MDKLVIQSYDKNDFQKEDKSKRFIAPINPETYSKNFKIELEKKRAHGRSGTDPRYISTEPEEMKLEFLLDGTRTMEGYVEEYKNLPVEKQLQKFLNCAYNMDGEIHRPRFLNILWGKEYLNFHCVLSSVEINHTLFDHEGKPLRLKIAATFMNYKRSEEQVMEQRKSSPDLTHRFKVRQGDRLDLMTYEVYDDPKYLTQVARLNGLNSLRYLPVGTDLSFPPFDKSDD